MFDNPKFPDQLSALGGDKANYRLPWEKAAANPRSFFGVTRVVAARRRRAAPPELSHLRPLFAGAGPASLADLAARYAAAAESAVRAWADGRATDDDVRWLDGLLRRGLLGNSIRLTPRLEALAAQYREVEADLSLPRVVPGIADCGPGIEQPVFVRGDCTKPGEPVPRRYLEVLASPGERFESAGQRPAGAGRADRQPRQPAHRPGDGQPRLAPPVRHRPGAHGRRLRPRRRAAVPPRAARLPGRALRGGRLVGEAADPLARAVAGVSDVEPALAGLDRRPTRRTACCSTIPARRMEAEAIRDSILAASGRLDRDPVRHERPAVPREDDRRPPPLPRPARRPRPAEHLHQEQPDGRRRGSSAPSTSPAAR